MLHSSHRSTGGRLRAYLQFLCALLYFFFARSLAARGADGLVSDAWFPPSFIALDSPAVSPTIDLTVHFRTSMPRVAAGDPDELCFARFRTGVLHDGFFEEDGVIWAQDGTVLAHSRQLAIMMRLPKR